MLQSSQSQHDQPEAQPSGPGGELLPPVPRTKPEHASEGQPDGELNRLFTHQTESIEEIQTGFQFQPNSLAPSNSEARRTGASGATSKHSQRHNPASTLAQNASSALVARDPIISYHQRSQAGIPAIEPTSSSLRSTQNSSDRGESDHIEGRQIEAAQSPKRSYFMYDSLNSIEQDDASHRRTVLVEFHRQDDHNGYNENDGDSTGTLEEVDVVRHNFEDETMEHNEQEILSHGQSIIDDTADVLSANNDENQLELLSTHHPSASGNQVADMSPQLIGKETYLRSSAEFRTNISSQHTSKPDEVAIKFGLQQNPKSALQPLRYECTDQTQRSIQHKDDVAPPDPKISQQISHPVSGEPRFRPEGAKNKSPSPIASVVTDLSFTPPVKRTRPQRRGGKGNLKEMKRKLPNRSSETTQAEERCLRPISRESNISKRRFPNPLPRPTAQTPLSPLRRTVRQERMILANSWNGYFSREHEYLEKLEAKINRLEGYIEEYEQTIEQFETAEVAQNEVIHKLEAENTELHASLNTQKKNFDTQDARIVELRSKCREYKDGLNRALVEQQQLYTKSKQNIKHIVHQLQTEQQASERSRENSMNAVLDQSESTRQTLQKHVNDVATHARLKIAELENTIEILKADLGGRQQELNQERESSKIVRSELEESHRVNTEVLRSLEVQNTKILEAVEEQQGRSKDSEQAVNECDSKLSSLADKVAELKAQVVHPGSITESLASTHKDITKSVVAEIQSLESWLLYAGTDQKGLARDKKIDEVITLCRTIDEDLRGEDGTMYWQQKCQKAEAKLLDAAEKQRYLQAEADNAVNCLQEVSGKHEELKSHTAIVEHEVMELQDKIEASREAQGESDRLGNLLSEKDTTIADLQNKLQESQDNNQKLQQALDMVTKSQEQNVTEGAQEIEQLRDKCQDVMERLMASVGDRTKMEQDLHKAKEKIQRLSSNREGEAKDLTRLLREDIRGVQDLTNSFNAIKTELSSLNPVSQWNESRANLCALEERYKNLINDLAGATKKRKELVMLSTVNEERIQVLDTLVEAETQTPGAHSEETLPSVEEMGRLRRVIVRSPIDEPVPPAPTVMEEREARRTTQPPKSSLRTTRQSTKAREMEREQENEMQANAIVADKTSDPNAQAVQRRLKSGLVTHSTFNRPVHSGSKRVQEDTAQVASKRRKTSEAGLSDGNAARPTRAMSSRPPVLGDRETNEEEVGKEDMLIPTTGNSRLAVVDNGYSRRNGANLVTYGNQAPKESGQPSGSSRRSTQRALTANSDRTFSRR
ncbi:hypothetical protein TruAng_000477 [Truncatella angustata]|nr:hypothetical protein TruAng_000477 [Truncatella angustata]